MRVSRGCSPAAVGGHRSSSSSSPLPVERVTGLTNEFATDPGNVTQDGFPPEVGRARRAGSSDYYRDDRCIEILLVDGATGRAAT
jgi:hypothetical protein